MIVNDELTLKQFINLYKNIKSGRSNKTAMLIKYYMDGCPACINFQDEWNKATRTSPHKHVQFVKLNSNVMERSPVPNVSGFPTVRLITSSSIHTFDEDRTAEKLLGFILKHSGKKSRMKNQKGLTKKGLTKKGLTKKELTKNGLTKNGLTKNGLTKKGLTKKGLNGGTCSSSSRRSRRGGSTRSKRGGGGCGCNSKKRKWW